MSSKTESFDRKPIAIKEFYVEFFGGLVPGVSFLFGIFPAFILPILTISLTFFPLPPITDILNSIKNNGAPYLGQMLVSSIGIIIFVMIPALIVFIVFAYIIGHLFSRQDYKKIDDRSLSWVRNRYKYESDRPIISHAFKVNKTPNYEKGKKGHKEIVETNTDWPYLLPDGSLRTERWPFNIYEFISTRKLNYLIFDQEKNSEVKPSQYKPLMNTLKLRIHMVSSEGSAILAKAEAHNRLSGAMWYVSWTLKWASIIGFVSSALSCWFAYDIQSFWSGYLESEVFHGDIIKLHLINFNYIIIFGMIFPMLIFFMSLYKQNGIVRSYYFQRQREVFYILEIAYWLFITDTSPHIFEGFNDLIHYKERDNTSWFDRLVTEFINTQS